MRVWVCGLSALLVACDGGSGVMVTLVAPGAVAAVAAQDGEGPWQALARQDGAFRFDVRSGRYRLAYVCLPFQMGEVIQATPDEASRFEVVCPDPNATGHDLTGAISGVAQNAAVMVSIGNRQMTYAGLLMDPTGRQYQATVPSGQYDLLAAAVNAEGETRLIIKRGLMFAGPLEIDLEFDREGVIAPLRPVTVSGAQPGEPLMVTVALTSAAGAQLNYWTIRPQAPLLDAASPSLVAGDSQVVMVSTLPDDRRATRATALAFDAATGTLPPFTLPPVLSASAESFPGSTVGARVRVTLQAPPPASLYQATMATTDGAGMAWIHNVSSGWLAGASSFELPDLATLPGFSADWAPSQTAPLSVVVNAVHSNRSLQTTLDGRDPLRTGDTLTVSGRFIVVTPARR